MTLEKLRQLGILLTFRVRPWSFFSVPVKSRGGILDSGNALSSHADSVVLGSCHPSGPVFEPYPEEGWCHEAAVTATRLRKPHCTGNVGVTCAAGAGEDGRASTEWQYRSASSGHIGFRRGRRDAAFAWSISFFRKVLTALSVENACQGTRIFWPWYGTEWESG